MKHNLLKTRERKKRVREKERFAYTEHECTSFESVYYRYIVISEHGRRGLFRGL